jgi:hypothetical protein
MSTNSPLLRLTLQDLDENPDTWGTVLNASALQLLEDSIAGTAVVDISAAQDYTLDDTAGGPTATNGARYMILDLNGSPGGARNVIVPTRSKVYLVANTSDGDVTVKTVAGSGPVIIAGEGQWVFCDGTDVQAASAATAVTAANATLAANSTLLNGIAESAFAQKAVAQTFTKGQVSERVEELIDTGNVNIDCANSNAFYHLTTAAFNLTAPANATNGQQFSLIVEQGTGAPHAITFASNTFIAAGGAPVLSTAFGSLDYLGFEYVTGLNDIGGARWVVSMIKNLGAI